MAERVTWEEIVKKYPDQWISLADPEVDEENNEINSGIVLAAGPDYDVVIDETKDAECATQAVRFTGEIKPFVGLARMTFE